MDINWSNLASDFQISVQTQAGLQRLDFHCLSRLSSSLLENQWDMYTVYSSLIQIYG